ncbi:DUF4901 domain-containing protein [Paratissierella segnis]|uniref:S-layer homology domain-containing protein n=1 Tax=Paratissierella segnis TaxID=2763679 RepID=A0A926EXU8_9FIRM|nr:DUF4901 domain-containing protein [Paratissierella segnis]MBC8588279.1 S-layer homology domain-containing protein [Paratissierella segnis]
MKNTLIFVLICSMVFSFIVPSRAYGQETSEKILESVILKMKELFDISNDYDGFVSQVNSYDNEVNFFLKWTDSKVKLPNINIQTDSKGNVISFEKYFRYEKESTPKLPSISKDEALKSALEFIEKIDPIIFKEIKLIPSTDPINTWDKNYNFYFIRVVGDIPYSENTISIDVNIETGNISSYYAEWERALEFPKAENIISSESAKEAYIKDIGLKLIYKNRNRYSRLLDADKDSKYYLAYSYIGEEKGIDAVTGKPIILSNYGIYRAMNEKAMDMGGEGGEPIITPEEQGEIDKLSGIKDVKEAEKKAREILKIDNTYKLQNHNLYSSHENSDDFFYRLGFLNANKDKNDNINISLDAKTLDLISFYKNRNIDANAKPIIKKSEALEIVKDYIKKINPEKVDEVEYMENSVDDDQQYYNFNFIRKVDEIYVESDSISIGIDAVNKDISSYNISWYKGEFPPKENIISIDKAYETLFDKIGLGLNYTSISSKDRENEKAIKLVYSISKDKPRIIDAHTGDILDNSGAPYKEIKIPNYDDILDSYAKDKINALAEYGIGFSNGKFKPKDKIKQKDFLYLLWKSTNPYRTETEADLDIVYEELARQNIIKEDEKNQERIVTKEEAAKFIVRAMKYEKLAEIPNIYKELFKDGNDIEEDLKGYMNIAYGLKIISGDGTGYIKPKYELKREDAANMIFEFLFN